MFLDVGIPSRGPWDFLPCLCIPSSFNAPGAVLTDTLPWSLFLGRWCSAGEPALLTAQSVGFLSPLSASHGDSLGPLDGQMQDMVLPSCLQWRQPLRCNPHSRVPLHSPAEATSSAGLSLRPVLPSHPPFPVLLPPLLAVSLGVLNQSLGQESHSPESASDKPDLTCPAFICT